MRGRSVFSRRLGNRVRKANGRTPEEYRGHQTLLPALRVSPWEV